MIGKILKHKNQFWLRVALLVAFALRVYLLGAQSLWNDEGNSVALAPLSLEAIANAAAHDIHPPLYYFLLHFWTPLAGQTEFAVRFLSVIAGVLTVAVTFRFARIFFDERVAIIAAYLSAFLAFQVYYSQEARMYIWMTLWSAVSVLAMMVMLKRGARGEGRSAKEKPGSSPPAPRNSRTQRTLAWLLYIAATIAALYTQYFAVSIVVAENAAFLIWLYLAWRDRHAVIASEAKKSPTAEDTLAPHASAGVASAHPFGSASLRSGPRLAMTRSLVHSVAFWVAAQVIVGLGITPWYLSVRDQLASWPAISESLDLPTLLWRVLNVFSVGATLDAATALPAAIAFGILLLFGLRWTRDAQTEFAACLLVFWLIAPVGVMFVISLARPAYNPKFLLLATPAFVILAARGLAQFAIPNGQFSIRHLLFVICTLVIISSSLLSLNNYYVNPAYARDDYRAILQFIDSNARAGDGILVDAPGQIDVVRYYWRGDQQLFLLPRMRPPDPAATRAEVDEMLGKIQRLFAIYYATEQSDPQSIVETRLAEEAFKARDEWYGNVRLAVYGATPRSPLSGQVSNARFGDQITLVAWQLGSGDARVGDVLILALNWVVPQSPTTRYKVFVHLLDANNRVIAQRDGEPVADTRITTTWRAGESIADNYGLFIEPGTPPGDYRIEIGMYRVDDGVRLPITASSGQALGDHLMLGTVRIR